MFCNYENDVQRGNKNLLRTRYLAPLCDLGLGDVLDGDGCAVLGALPRVDGAEAALAQHPPHAVGPLEGLPPALGAGPRQDGLQVGTGVARQAAHPQVHLEVFSTRLERKKLK